MSKLLLICIASMALLSGCETPPDRTGTTVSNEGGDYNREMHMEEQADVME